MRHIALFGALLVAVLAAALVRGAGPEEGVASSHREAPVISEDPTADNTDVYAFVSPDRPNTVTIVANYIPLEEPAGGPNFNKFADDVLYELKVDNNGDGREDVSYQFEFDTQTRNGNTFLYNTGPIDSLSDTDWNRPQRYKVTRVKRSGSTVFGRNLPTPPVNIGPRSTANYGALMQSAVRQLSGGIKVFAGQSDDPFFVDLGSIFDLAGLRPFNPAHVIPLDAENGVDGVGGYNTHAIVLQVPITQLTRDGQLHDADDPEAVIGVYATASRQRVQVIETDGRRRDDGNWVQVSRLAEPLINEVVIPLRKKDRWNASDPSDDADFLSHYTSPELTRLGNLLYPVLDDAPETGRGDLAAILLTGVPGLNFTGPKKADLIRLNTGIAPTSPVGGGNRLGVLGGDFAGFPNGRRLEDDVTDIEIRALMCGYGPTVGPLIESLGFCGGNANRSPNNMLGDRVDANDRPFQASFPYVPVPHQGYAHAHHDAMGGP
ncbi:MAG TPA: DUF4331 domain-containing protein [Gaiellaceae bacterium]|nr:DUF4331 domain-containing protein [Gaiellaceae bacterium]